MTDQPAPKRRKRGAQPGNLNALTHGFYASRLPDGHPSLGGLFPPMSDGLDNEIAMIRLTIRSLIDKSIEPQPLDVEIVLLRSLSLATTALVRMLKTRTYVNHSNARLARLMPKFDDDPLVKDLMSHLDDPEP